MGSFQELWFYMIAPFTPGIMQTDDGNQNLFVLCKPNNS